MDYDVLRWGDLKFKYPKLTTMLLVWKIIANSAVLLCWPGLATWAGHRTTPTKGGRSELERWANGSADIGKTSSVTPLTSWHHGGGGGVVCSQARGEGRVLC